MIGKSKRTVSNASHGPEPGTLPTEPTHIGTGIMEIARRRFPEPTPAERAEWAKKDAERIEREKLAKEAAERKRRYANWLAVLHAVGRRYENCTLESFEFSDTPTIAVKQKAVIAKLRNFEERLLDQIENGTNLLLLGSVGTGKDHLIIGLARAACCIGKTVGYVGGMDLFASLRDSIGTAESEQQLLHRFTAPDVLVLSDPVPPVGELTVFQTSFLFRVIDHRYRNRKPIWVSANFLAKTDEASDALGIQLFDRLRHGALQLECRWPSYRRPVEE